MTIVSELASDLFRRKYDAINKKWESLPPKTRERIEKWVVKELKRRTREEFSKYMKHRRKKK